MSPAVASSSQDKIKKKKKDKAKPISKELVDEMPVDDADGSSYRPPEGAKLLTDFLEDDHFDYDRLKNDDDLELVLIRVPEGVCFSNVLNHKISKVCILYIGTGISD